MSVHDELMQPTSDSFWEVGKYSRTVKRADNGYKLCDNLKLLIEQRSEIEKGYARQLTQWSRKWTDFLDKGPEYGTTQAAWRGCLAESDGLSELHSEMAEKLMNVHARIKTWQKESYHKSMMHFKEPKEFDDNFKKAQKPWEKRYIKVQAAKKDYHAACRQEKSCGNQENNAKGDSSVSTDQLRKLQEKLEKCQREVETTREKFTAALNDLNGYNAKYIEDMKEIFQGTQEFERKRLDFFKDLLFQIHRCVDLSVNPRHSDLYTALHQTISNAEADKDLKWWTTSHGVDMPMNWPVFEEYSPELQAISKKSGKSQFGTSGDGITITSIKHSRETSGSSDITPPVQSYTASSSSTKSTTNHQPARQKSYDESLNPFGDDNDDDEKSAEKASSAKDLIKNGGEVNPFGDPDPDWNGQEETSQDNKMTDDGRPGVPVRALYDYDATDVDEISFKCGDVFTKLSDEDEQGWCKGRKGHSLGLYPANYVEPI